MQLEFNINDNLTASRWRVPANPSIDWRRDRDSNPGAAFLQPSAFQAAPLGLSGTSPVVLAAGVRFELTNGG